MPAGAERGELVIRRLLPAPPALVWQVWTTPAHIMQWWGPRGCVAFSCTMDPRPGGAWRVGMRAPDGEVLWTRGEFHELVPPSRMVMSFAWDGPVGVLGGPTVVTIDLTEHAGQTQLVLRHHGFETDDARDRHLAGWIDSIDRFAEHLSRPAKDSVS